MDKELEWLKDNMPEGWGLVLCLDGEYMPMCEYRLYESDGDFATTVYTDHGDIGLGSVTALLKQELLRMRWYCHTFQSKQRKWSCCLQRGRIRLGKCRDKDTEFEAVMAAYREQRLHG